MRISFSSPSTIRVNLVLGRQDLAMLDMWFQALAKVHGAPHGVGDGHQEQQYRNDGKCSQTPSGWVIILNSPVRSWGGTVVHAHQFEEKVGEGGKVEEHCSAHAYDRLTPREPGCHEQNYDCDWDGDDGEVKLDVGCVAYYDEELYRKGQEEEEVELEEGDINLEGNVLAQM